MMMRVFKYSIPEKLNLILMITLTVANLFAMLYLPLVLLPQNFSWAWLLIPIVLCTTTYWSLIHEGIHSIFHARKKINEISSRIMAIIFGTVFQIAQFGHLMHHAYNRTEVDRPEVYESDKQNYYARTMRYYFKLTIGLYMAEFFGPLIAFLPRSILGKIADKLYGFDPNVEKIIENRLLNKKSLLVIRCDALIMYVLYAMVFYCYGHYAWLWVLFMVARGFLISVADNLPHYATPISQVRYAHNLAMTPLLSKFILHFNLHGIHHDHPNVPWVGLPKIQQETQAIYDIGYFKQGLRQFKGVVDLNLLL